MGGFGIFQPADDVFGLADNIVGMIYQGRSFDQGPDALVGSNRAYQQQQEETAKPMSRFLLKADVFDRSSRPGFIDIMRVWFL